MTTTRLYNGLTMNQIKAMSFDEIEAYKRSRPYADIYEGDKRTITKPEGKGGVYYDLPEIMVSELYHGCGKGWLETWDADNTVIDFGYYRGVNFPDAETSKYKYGDVISSENGVTTYCVMFSCCQACLF